MARQCTAPQRNISDHFGGRKIINKVTKAQSMAGACGGIGIREADSDGDGAVAISMQQRRCQSTLHHAFHFLLLDG